MPRDGAPTRERILDVAERLVIENGFAATSVDEVIERSRTSKGSFFHHFPTKQTLAEALVDRYARADVGHLEAALEATAEVSDPRVRLVAFLRVFEDEGDALVAEQSSCLYAAMLAERQLAGGPAGARIAEAVVAWREGVAALVDAALEAAGRPDAVDAQAWADHLFVTFEGAFILCRSTGDPSHMNSQLRALRLATEALLANP